jgi:hypothetical protein
MRLVTPQPASGLGATGRLAGFGGAGLDGARVDGRAAAEEAVLAEDAGEAGEGRAAGDVADVSDVGDAVPAGAAGVRTGTPDGDGPDTAGDSDGCRPRWAASAAPPSTPATPSPTNALTNQDAFTATSTTAAGSRPVSGQSKVSCVVRRGISSSTATPSAATTASATKTLCVAS